jgi:hypothetical protein
MLQHGCCIWHALLMCHGVLPLGKVGAACRPTAVLMLSQRVHVCSLCDVCRWWCVRCAHSTAKLAAARSLLPAVCVHCHETKKATICT